MGRRVGEGGGWSGKWEGRRGEDEEEGDEEDGGGRGVSTYTNLIEYRMNFLSFSSCIYLVVLDWETNKRKYFAFKELKRSSILHDIFSVTILYFN